MWRGNTEDDGEKRQQLRHRCDPNIHGHTTASGPSAWSPTPILPFSLYNILTFQVRLSFFPLQGRTWLTENIPHNFAHLTWQKAPQRAHLIHRSHNDSDPAEVVGSRHGSETSQPEAGRTDTNFISAITNTLQTPA